MQILHTMVRVSNVESSLAFYCDALGMIEISRYEVAKGRFTLIFLAAPDDSKTAIEKDAPLLELTHNWDPEPYEGGRNFGHLAFRVNDIYAACSRLADHGVLISRPPRDGHMAFVRSPDGISIELLQAGKALPPSEPWASVSNTGEW